VLGPGAPTWTSNGSLVNVELAVSSTAPTATSAPPTETTVPTTPATAIPPTATVSAPTATATTGAPASSPTPGGSAPEWVNFYGTASSLDGSPLPVGALVEAWSASGVRCGSFTVTLAGAYGVLPCQKAEPGQPGIQPGDTVYFTVNGRAARTLGPDDAVWSSHGDRRHVELDVPPLTPIAATNTPLPTHTATPSGTTIAPEWVNFYGTSTVLDGAPVPAGAKVEAFAPDGTKCGEFTVTTPGSYGVLPCVRSPIGVPGAHAGDTISFTINGRPATALGPDAAVWTFNGDLRHVELNVAAVTPVPTNTIMPTVTSTPSGPGGAPEWVNFYGTSSVYDGAPLPVGAVVVAWSPDGVQCGSFTVTTAGSYGVLACLGSPVGLPGAHPGDAIYFTINGRAALTKGPDSSVWTTHGDLRHVELEIPAATPAPTATPTTGAGTPVSPTPTAQATPIVTPTGTVAAPTPTTTTAPGATATSTTMPAATPTMTPPGTGVSCDGVTYVVRWGAWLYKIARRFGVSAADILYCNPLPNPNLLRPGQQLVIPGVTPTPTPSVTPPPACTIDYIVRPGDTLSGIAMCYKTTVRAIMDANGLVNPNYIYVGQKLKIPVCATPPSGQTHVVRYGDTLWGISLKYGVSMWSLAVINNLYYPYIIYPGQVLALP